MNLTTPTYSFVHFENNKFQLPILQGDTVSFQVRIDDVGDETNWTLQFRNVSNYNDLATLSNVSIVKEGVLLNISFTVDTLDYSQSYEVRLTYRNQPAAPVEFISNKFKVMNIETTVVQYQHFSDFLDLGYETATVLMNQVRLPFRLYNHIPATVTEQYQKSDGQFVSFGNFINDIYEVETPFMSSQIHKCIQAMFLHRTIQVVINSVLHSIQLSENYQLEYPENKNFGLAKAKAKVSAAAV